MLSATSEVLLLKSHVVTSDSSKAAFSKRAVIYLQPLAGILDHATQLQAAVRSNQFDHG
jgi:hypothetical protein